GYALPLRRVRDAGQPYWQSGRWFLRREHLYLIPGDSPIGYRLPLDSVPWEAAEARDHYIEPDPFAPRAPLPTQAELMQKYLRKPDPAFALCRDTDWEASHPGPGSLVRTSLCVEPREGRLFVFLPPQSYTEDFLDLVAAIEATARALYMPVQLEGY